jgi:CRISPR-associated protein Csx17
MPLHIHHLTGCAPAPLTHYLKALGILRLVAEQKDPTARGWWKGEAFHLATTLDRAELEHFFLHEYQPTPMFNPWGARSGYYPGSSEKSSRAALNKIEKSTSKRFEPFQATITIVRSILAEQFKNRKPEEDEQKERLVRLVRQAVDAKASAWIDTCVTCLAEGTAYPAIFGTGASEGSGSYMSAYMLALDQSLIEHNYDDSLRASLWAAPLPSTTWSETFGHFLPAGIGGPWELLLSFEGICQIRSAVTSTSKPFSSKWLSSPFFVAPVASAYGSSSPQDEIAVNKGKKMPGRGEQWFPLWERPLLNAEVKTVFGQGRASLKKGTARDAVSMTVAIANMGVQQGISTFVRFGYQQRNNLATHFAVPLGKYAAPERGSVGAELVAEILPWLDRLRKVLRNSKNSPASLLRSERVASGVVMSLCEQASLKTTWQSLLLALSDIEEQLVRSHSFTAKQRLRPIPPLSGGWIAAANDQSREFRLAVALALQTSDDKGRESIRGHWQPLDKTGLTFAADSSGLRKDPEVVCHGLEPERDLLALLQRRSLHSSKHLALMGHSNYCASPPDIAALLNGNIDLRKTLQLARALLALDRRSVRGVAFESGAHQLPPIYSLFRLVTLPWPLEVNGSTIPIRYDPAIVTRLASGGADSLRMAGEMAIRRLKAAGLTPVIRQIAGDETLARRIALSLAFPISPRTAEQLALSVTKTQTTQP